jgi:hypothetical protein
VVELVLIGPLDKAGRTGPIAGLNHGRHASVDTSAMVGRPSGAGAAYLFVFQALCPASGSVCRPLRRAFGGHHARSTAIHHDDFC